MTRNYGNRKRFSIDVDGGQVKGLVLTDPLFFPVFRGIISKVMDYLPIYTIALCSCGEEPLSSMIVRLE